ncbi:hypothetical protein J2X06_002464 [Lysobacter niastensis]|uniref:Uncharacterized protein n=1 Tax=Lysobacter niastensis TaxID=380629 RepID=A0ABU1WCW6_9GAMM|nr:hypothetical protein [Lysobacter niastensis]
MDNGSSNSEIALQLIAALKASHNFPPSPNGGIASIGRLIALATA